MMKIIVTIGLFICISVWFTSCKTTEPIPQPNLFEEDTFFVPAGVDTIIAVLADSIAGQSFVSADREKHADMLKARAQSLVNKSDSLWQYLTLEQDNNYTISEDDSIKAIEAYNDGANAFIRSQEITAKSSNSNVDQFAQQNELLDQAQKAFEEALTFNPFDVETKYGLSLVYQKKAIRLTDNKEYEKAIDILERLAQVEKGEDAIFARLGESYYALHLWADASENFQKAERVFKDNLYLDPTKTNPGELTREDSVILFNYIFFRGDSQTNMYLADQALNTFAEAKSIAPTPELQGEAQYMINYIHWDDGNIAGRMARDSINTLRAQGHLEKAEEEYIKLLDRLKTQKAKDEIHWRTALTHYEMGKDDEAADRLMKLVNRTETRLRDGTPVDSTYNQYFEDYGIISYNIGMQYLKEERNRLVALKYFKQVSTFPWSNRAKTNLEISKIINNNIPEAIQHAEKALTEVNRLNKDDEKELYRRLSDLNRRHGNMEAARKYIQKWRDV
ncbi:MAG: hypothetical protein WD267_04805 [Balneolales bacterium]